MKLTQAQLNKLDKEDLIDIILQLQGNEETPNYVPTYPFVVPNRTGDYPNNPYTWTSCSATSKTNTDK